MKNKDPQKNKSTVILSPLPIPNYNVKADFMSFLSRQHLGCHGKMRGFGALLSDGMNGQWIKCPQLVLTFSLKTKASSLRGEIVLFVWIFSEPIAVLGTNQAFTQVNIELLWSRTTDWGYSASSPWFKRTLVSCIPIRNPPLLAMGTGWTHTRTVCPDNVFLSLSHHNVRYFMWNSFVTCR